MKTPAQKAADKRANALLLPVKRRKPHCVRHIVITPANPIVYPVWKRA